MKYRKKPVVIDAIQWDGSYLKYYTQISEEFPELETILINNRAKEWVIATLEGQITASAGDYIIKGLAGEFYPCKSKIFEKSYELV